MSWSLDHGAAGGPWRIGTLVFWLAVTGWPAEGVRVRTRTPGRSADGTVEVLRRRLAAQDIHEAEPEKVENGRSADGAAHGPAFASREAVATPFPKPASTPAR